MSTWHPGEWRGPHRVWRPRSKAQWLEHSPYRCYLTRAHINRDRLAKMLQRMRGGRDLSSWTCR